MFRNLVTHFLCIVTGCTSVRTISNLPISSHNYKLLKVGATGESPGLRFLGLIPLRFSKRAEARSNLFTKAGISPENRQISLIHQVEERLGAYFISGSSSSTTLTADNIEFDSPPQVVWK
jgi:hypothetical protein